VEVCGLELLERTGEKNSELLVLGVFDDELEVERRVLHDLALEDQERLFQSEFEVVDGWQRDGLQLDDVASSKDCLLLISPS